MALQRYEPLLALLPLDAAPADSAHDARHLRRVLTTAVRLAEAAGAALDVVVPAAWLHDLVQYPKADPRNVGASRESAARAVERLRAINYAQRRGEWFPAPKGGADGAAALDAEALYAMVAHAIEAHSFSAGIPPRTLEAEVVRDADRLDALGAIGLARMFAVSGALGRPLYHESDPFAATARALDDKEYAVDHVYVKLFKLTFCTAAAQAEAARRVAAMQSFLDQLKHELGV